MASASTTAGATDLAEFPLYILVITVSDLGNRKRITGVDDRGNRAVLTVDILETKIISHGRGHRSAV